MSGGQPGATAVAAGPAACGSGQRLALGGLLFLVCLQVYAFVAGMGWNNTILDVHGFRQTQTALTTYFMIGQAPKLAYETPVLGPPWSIPLEFPLYQWIVAAAVQVLHTPLDQTGRFVSVAFFLLSFFPTWFVLGKLKVSRDHRFYVLALLALTPEYLFWSRTFMGESLALFLGASFLALAWEFLDRPTPICGLAGAVLGGLAGAVKITTFALFLGAFLFVLGLRCLHGLYRRQGLARLFHAALALGLLAVVPLLASYSWTRYADGVKERNPFGGDHLTSQNLQAWNFGAWTDRGDGQKWRAIHALARLGVSGYAAAACLAGLCLASAAALPARWRRRPPAPAPVPLAARWLAVAACLGVYLSGPLVFFNLYLIHDYYYFANTIFLVVAMGLGLVALIETGRAGQVVALALLLAALGGSLRRYSQHYFDLQTVNHAEILAICRQIQDHTRPDDVLVIIGHDWTPDLAYYSRRRALMLPFWRPESVETFCGKLAEIKDQSWGALLIDRAGESRFPQADILRAIEHSGFQARHLATQDLLELYTLHRAAPARSGLGPRSRLSLRESSVSFVERKTTLAARERLPQDLLELYGLKRAAPARVANGERR